MTTEADRVNRLELWAARHEEGCSGRHTALNRRLDALDVTAIEVKADLATRMHAQDFWATARWVAIMVAILLGAMKDTKFATAILELLK